MQRSTGLIVLALVVLLTGCSGDARTNSDSPNLNIPAAIAGLDELPAPATVDPALWTQLKDALRSQLEARGSEGRIVQAAPTADASRCSLSLDSVNLVLNWSYYSQGDYDQNGEVNISDLTPIAVHFGEASGGGPFDPTSVQSVIDGDDNGEINISDISPIGVNFGRSVGSYSIHMSTNSADYPAANGDPDGAGIMGVVPLSEAQGNAASARRTLSFAIPASPGLSGTEIFWVRPNDTVDGSGDDGTPSNMTGPGAPIQSSIELFQLSFDFGGSDVHDSTDWGTVDVSFPGISTLLYFNMTYNGTEVLTNIPLISDSGLGVLTTVSLPFSLGVPAGTLVTSASVAYSLETAPKAVSALGRGTSAEDEFAVLARKLAEAPDGTVSGTPGPAQNNFGRDPANDGVITASAAHDILFPVQEDPLSTISPTALAVSNSLEYLRTEFDLAIGEGTDKPIDAAAMSAWGNSPLDAGWPALKDAFMKDNGYPIETRETYDVNEVLAAMQAGCDVEIFTTDEVRPNYAHALTSIAVDSQGNVVTQETWDAQPGQSGGQYKQQMQWKISTSTYAPYGSIFDNGYPVSFVIECPQESAKWHSRTLYPENFGGLFPSSCVLANGDLGLAFMHSFTDLQIYAGSLSKEFLLPSGTVNVNENLTRTHGTRSKLIRLPDDKVACLYQDSVPGDNTLQCCVSTDETCTEWGSPVQVPSSGGVNEVADFDCMIDQNGRLDICYLDSSNVCMVQAVDAECTAFTAQATVPFSYGLHIQCCTDGTGTNYVAWEGSGGLKILSAVDCTDASGSGPVDFGADCDDFQPFGMCFNETADEIQVCYRSSIEGLMFTHSSDGSSFATPVSIDAPGFGKGLSLALSGSDIPAVCSFNSLSLEINYVESNDASGSSWSAPQLVATPTEIPGESYLELIFNPLDDAPVIFGPALAGFRCMGCYYLR